MFVVIYDRPGQVDGQFIALYTEYDDAATYMQSVLQFQKNNTPAAGWMKDRGEPPTNFGVYNVLKCDGKGKRELYAINGVLFSELVKQNTFDPAELEAIKAKKRKKAA